MGGPKFRVFFSSLSRSIFTFFLLSGRRGGREESHRGAPWDHFVKPRWRLGLTRTGLTRTGLTASQPWGVLWGVVGCCVCCVCCVCVVCVVCVLGCWAGGLLGCS